MDEKQFTIPVGDDEQLSCVLTEAYSHSAVILAHGFRGHKNVSQFLEASTYFAEHDYTAIRFDFRGCGDSDRSFSEQSLTTQKEDLEAVYDYAADRFEHVAVVGSSMGGYTALNADIRPCAVALWAPALRLKQLTEEHHDIDWETALREEETTLTDSSGESYTVGSAYIETVHTADPTRLAATVDTPTLFIHGTEDERVPADHTMDLFEAFSCRRELILLHANHFLQPVLDRALDETVDWFDAYCKHKGGGAA